MITITSINTDPFENPKSIVKRHPRTLSAPVTIQLMRKKSASIYRSNPGGGGVVPVRIPGRRTYSAMPRMSRSLSTIKPIIEVGTE